jgi:hexulose-6-phosphate isomerase
MKKGINGWTFPGVPVVEAARQARAAGFEVFEPTINAEGELTPTTGEADCRRIADEIRATGLEISSVATGMWIQTHYTAEDPAVREAAMRLTLACLDRARWLGAGAVLVIPGLVRHEARPRELLCSYETALTRTYHALQQLMPEAERRGVTLAVENMWNSFLLSPLEMRDLIDRVNSAWVGVYLDVGNLLRYGMPEDWIRILGRRLSRVHVKDYKLAVGTREGFVPPGDGDANWPAIVEALRQTGYDGPLICEGKGDPADMAARLERILAIS